MASLRWSIFALALMCGAGVYAAESTPAKPGVAAKAPVSALIEY